MPHRRPRDMRLDFFRGLCLFIIFIAHVPWNPWNNWIPARFGFSDAAEIFVFCSGMASAIAFGAVFRERSWLIGAARTGYRVWQVYWAHIALFIATVALLSLFDLMHGEDHYTRQLYVRPFLDDAGRGLIGLMTLTYVPNYFDILPMYLAILAMMPIVVWLARVHRALAFAFVGLVWLGANLQLLQLPAEWWSDREWFFNPFGWQLVFFTGFALMSGWLPAPPINRPLISAAVLVLLLNAVLAHRWGWQNFETIYAIRDAIWPTIGKTDQGLMRYLHFLALAYVAYAWAGEGGRRLAGQGLWGGFVGVVRKVGQQSLAVFLAGMFLAQCVGWALDHTGRTWLTVALGNLAGFAMLTGVAYAVAWFKSQPWRKPASTAAPLPALQPAPADSRRLQAAQ